MLTVTSALASAAPLLNQVQSANSKDILILIRYAKFKVGLKQALGMAFVPIHNHVAFFLECKARTSNTITFFASCCMPFLKTIPIVMSHLIALN